MTNLAKILDPRPKRRRQKHLEDKEFHYIMKQQPTFSGVTRAIRREDFKHTKSQTKFFPKKRIARKKKHRNWLRRHNLLVLECNYSPLSFPLINHG